MYEFTLDNLFEILVNINHELCRWQLIETCKGCPKSLACDSMLLAYHMIQRGEY